MCASYGVSFNPHDVRLIHTYPGHRMDGLTISGDFGNSCHPDDADDPLELPKFQDIRLTCESRITDQMSQEFHRIQTEPEPIPGPNPHPLDHYS